MGWLSVLLGGPRRRLRPMRLGTIRHCLRCISRCSSKWNSGRRMSISSTSQLLRNKCIDKARRLGWTKVLVLLLAGLCLTSFIAVMNTLGPMDVPGGVQSSAVDEETSDVTTAIVEPISDDQIWDKWIVITSIFSPSSDVVRLAGIDGWRVVVVGDLKTPPDWRYPGVVYLGVEEQRRLAYEIVQRLPFNSYTRKNIGYLYAIEHGARYIYDTDDDNHPTGDQFGFRLGPTITGLLHRDTTYDVMNPYTHFGQPSIWPRGYPLNAIRRRQHVGPYPYTLCTFETPSIQQGLVDGDPDVDAIFRLTRNESPSSRLNVTFDARTPPLTLDAAGVYAPFNSQNTLFRYEAFWALFLPTSVAFRVTDIWRGYWAQRLMQLVNQRLAFLPPNAVQMRNVHDYLDDFVEEIQMYTEAELLVAFLKRWQCPASMSISMSLFDCARHLTEDMAKAHFWGAEEPAMVHAWLSDLERIGYQVPSLVQPSSASETCLGEPTNARTVFYAPVVKSTGDQHRIPDRAEKLVEFCKHDLSYNVSTWYEASPDADRRPYDNVLLIVVFNRAYLQIIPMLDNLYYDHFPNIAYCGETVDLEHLAAEMASADAQFAWIRRPGGVTFINITADEGFFSYECVVRAMQMNYAVDGYLVVHDDVLFNFWNVDMDADYAAYEWDSYGYQVRYLDTTANDTWYFWASEYGYNNTNRALDELKSDYERTGDPLLAEYFANIDGKGLTGQVGVDYSDIYYVPESKGELFRRVIQVFLRNRSFVEIAVPTVIHGLHDIELNQLYGTSLEHESRFQWTTYYNSSNVYLHPVKLSYVLARSVDRRAYCQTYVKDLLYNVYGLMSSTL